MVKIAVLASFNMDLVMRAERRPAAGETLQGEFAMFLGGKGFNQAVAARRLGAEVAVTGRVGDDEFGRLFLAALDREGIDRRAVCIDPDEGTGVASITVEPHGANTILQSPRANRNVTPDDIDRALPALSGADIAMLQLETSMPAAVRFAQQMRATGTRVMLNPAPAASAPAELMALADVLVANQIEAASLTKGSVETTGEAIEAARAISANRATAVVVTLGADGAICVHHQQLVTVSGYAVEVTDTTGAGDAFCAAFALSGQDIALSGQDIALSGQDIALSGQDIAGKVELGDALRFANAAGALACTKRGAEPSMPTRAEVESLLARGVTREPRLRRG